MRGEEAEWTALAGGGFLRRHCSYREKVYDVFEVDEVFDVDACHVLRARLGTGGLQGLVAVIPRGFAAQSLPPGDRRAQGAVAVIPWEFAAQRLPPGDRRAPGAVAVIPRECAAQSLLRIVLLRSQSYRPFR